MLLTPSSELFILYKQNFLLRQLVFLVENISKYINSITLSKYYIDIQLKSSHFVSIIKLLQKQWFLRYTTVVDMVAVDYPMLKYRFTLTYVFLSYDTTQKLLVSQNIHEKQNTESLTPLFKGTGWQEREVWDFFGIFFNGNTDLRRILTDYGFSGHPLRKDFPLTGFYEVIYDDRRKYVNYRHVSLAQEFRNFRSVNPWLMTSSIRSI